MEIMCEEYDEYCRGMLTERIATEGTIRVRILPYEIISARLNDDYWDAITGITFVHESMRKYCGEEIVLKSHNICDNRVNTSSNSYWWSYRWLDLDNETVLDWEVSI